MAAVPEGTVTFLLTDVEASTHLWMTRPDDMPAAIARHYAALDESIAAHGGVRPQEQGEGDSVVAAFVRPSDAVAAAIDAQRRLAADLPWLGVRMALHTGEAQLRDDRNYVGPAIIRTARLRALAHGGQILVSSATAGLLPGISLRSVGSVVLRGFAGPEEVWQVEADDLRQDFPPLASAPAAHHLPTVLTSFVGRADERVSLTKLVRQERIVTVTGSALPAGRHHDAIEQLRRAVRTRPTSPALHVLTMLAHRAGRIDHAALVLAAVRAEQERSGAVLPYDLDPVATAAAEGELREAAPDAWHAGSTLPFGDAVALALDTS